jgi:hypothetical protein
VDRVLVPQVPGLVPLVGLDEKSAGQVEGRRCRVGRPVELFR